MHVHVFTCIHVCIVYTLLNVKSVLKGGAVLIPLFVDSLAYAARFPLYLVWCMYMCKCKRHVQSQGSKLRSRTKLPRWPQTTKSKSPDLIFGSHCRYKFAFYCMCQGLMVIAYTCRYTCA